MTGWSNERRQGVTGVLCNKKEPWKVKRKFYEIVMRPEMLCGSEFWTTNKKEIIKMRDTEMRMLKWTSGMTS